MKNMTVNNHHKQKRCLSFRSRPPPSCLLFPLPSPILSVFLSRQTRHNDLAQILHCSTVTSPDCGRVCSYWGQMELGAEQREVELPPLVPGPSHLYLLCTLMPHSHPLPCCFSLSPDTRSCCPAPSSHDHCSQLDIHKPRGGIAVTNGWRGLLACYVHITAQHNYLSWGGGVLMWRLDPDNMGVIFKLAITQRVDTNLILKPLAE